MPDLITTTPTAVQSARPARRPRYRRRFTGEGQTAEEVLEAAGPWSRRTARIEGADGKVVFEQEDVEAPESWSQMAVNVVASKYLRGKLGTPERETSVRQLLERVVRTISAWGLADEYLNAAEVETFAADLTHLLVNQRAAFNSPVWFNVGVEERPQCSACFINRVEDSMESILDLAKTEGLIFKYGSGAGVNLSALRGREETLSGGGTASGPVSFLRGYDAFAGVIKSGGKTRRAAKIVVLDADHPDAVEFLTCKVEEERKAAALEAAGYSGGIDGDAYRSVFFQNANLSLRTPDAFLEAVEEGGTWALRARTNGEVLREVPARDLWDALIRSAHECGDPGIQFHDAVNRWHTCPEDGEIRASNPCGEFVFLDESACNLASLNLRRFQRVDGTLDVEDFIHAVETLILAQEILVDRASYPTPGIELNARRFRPLGLGYANLGAYLMVAGVPYDSDAGRAHAAALTALMTGVAYRTSAELAARRGPFQGYERNRTYLQAVLRSHERALDGIAATARRADAIPPVPTEVRTAARSAWREARELAEVHGVRNAQTTLLAPTGTIAFLMDCDTTGVEPDIALVKRKALVGGGELVYENRSVGLALGNLGYDGADVELVLTHLREKGTLVGSQVRPEHLAVFDCALSDAAGRVISWEGHVRMVGAVQPFLSGAVSKTVNLPEESTPEDVGAVYLLAHRLGLKSITVYRDRSKRTQPLERGNGKNGNGKRAGTAWSPPPPVARVGERERLPRTRRSETHKFDVAGHEGYFTAGMYPDGRLGELFVVMAKQGSTVSGLLDAWATAVSISLQYGVPWEVLAEKFGRTRFEPAGFTDNPEINPVTSVLDYIVRWLGIRFPAGRYLEEGEEAPPREAHSLQEALETVARPTGRAWTSGPPCAICGSIMEPNGGCHRCPTCGTTNGCG